MRRTARTGAALLALAGAGLPAAADACLAPDWALAAGAEHSRWQEHDANGRRLVAERGDLATLAARAGVQCAGLQWQAVLGLAAGRRAYQGQSTTGQPVASHSDLRRLHWQLAALAPLGAPADGLAWWAGAEAGQALLWRDIASAGAVRGYPERFDQWQAAALLVHRRALAPGLGLQATLALGGGPAGRLHLHLPIADPALLRLGSSRLARLDVALLGGTMAPGLAVGGRTPGWQLHLQWQQQRTGAGPAATLWRHGVAVGGAAQPAWRQDALGLQAVLQW